MATSDRSGIRHALLHVVTDADLRWHRAEDIDACAGVKAPRNWCITLPLSQRVQPGVYTLMATSRYRDALVRHLPPAEPRVYPPLVPDILTSCFDVLLLPPRPFRIEKPLTQDAFQTVSVFLQKRCAYPELCENHNGPGALLLTPRLDAQTSFAKLFADIGTQEDVRRADLAAGAPSPAQVTVKHVQVLRFDLRAETLSHAAGLTAHTAIVLFGSSKFLGRDELGHSRTTVGLTRSRGVTVLATWRVPRSVRPHRHQHGLRRR